MNVFSKYSLVSLTATALIAVPLAFAAKPPPPPTNENVTTTVYDDSGQTQLVIGSDDYNKTSPAGAIYPSGVAINGSKGGWSLDLFNQSARTVYLTLLQPVAGSPPSPAPQGYYSADVQIYSFCYDAAGAEFNFTTIPAGNSFNCIFGMDFLVGRKAKYKLEMGQNTGAPYTGLATVKCIADGVGLDGKTECISWTIAAPTGTVANLYEFGGTISLGGPADFTFIGQYYISFLINVTYP